MSAEVLRFETGIIREIIRNPQCRLRFTTHCRTEMVSDCIIEADIWRVLNVGLVSWIEIKKDEIWHVEGRDSDGRRLRIVLVADRIEIVIKLITAMLLKA